MFENIVGHEKQKETLFKMVDSGNISHAYLFFGNKGIGKYTLAIEFAKKILDVDNLGDCPDFKIIRKKEDKKDIVVEQIRKEIIDELYLAPASSSRKVYIIDDAELLNKAAQNALLKTLEEPPKYITIVLIASNLSAFLSTIVSRVNKVAFDGINDELLKKFIDTKYDVVLEDKVIEYLEGSIGKAVDVIENNVLEELKKVDNLYSVIKEKDFIKAMKISGTINFSNQYLLDYLEYIIHKEDKHYCIKFVENAKIRLNFNGNYDIIIDTMLLRLIDSV